MPNITLTFSNPLPEGIQVGDVACSLTKTTNEEVVLFYGNQWWDDENK